MSETLAPPKVDMELRRATIEVLRERGWDGLTLERVAEAAGRARSTIWRQGLSREALVSALTGELDRGPVAAGRCTAMLATTTELADLQVVLGERAL